MKPTIDFFGGALSEFIQSERFKNKVIKLYGTKYIDDVKVFNENFGIYPGTEDSNVQEMLELFNMKSQIEEQNWEGISNAWIYFNPNKSNAQKFESIATVDYVQTKLNNLYDIDVEYSFHLNLYLENTDVSLLSITNEQKIDFIINNYNLIFNNAYGNSDGNEETLDGLCKYLMFDNNQHFEIVLSKPNIQTYQISKKESLVIEDGLQDRNKKILNYSIGFDMKVKRISYIQKTSNIVVKISSINDINEQNIVLSSLEQTRDNDGISSDRTTVTNTVFYKDHLRFSLTDSNIMKTSDFVNVVINFIDVGFQKKKVKWYKKIIAMAIFVVAVILSVPSGGTTLTVAQVAFTFAMVTIELVVISLVLSKVGMVDIANSLGKFIKMSSFVATVTGIGSVITAIARQGLMTYIQVSISGMSTFSFQSLRYLSMAADFFYKNKLDKIQTSNNKLQDKLDEQEKLLAEMYSGEYNISAEYIKFEHDLLKRDSIEFEVDYKYEGTKLNIQRRSFV
jgi:hypothetical protein